MITPCKGLNVRIQVENDGKSIYPRKRRESTRSQGLTSEGKGGGRGDEQKRERKGTPLYFDHGQATTMTAWLSKKWSCIVHLYVCLWPTVLVGPQLQVCHEVFVLTAEYNYCNYCMLVSMNFAFERVARYRSHERICLQAYKLQLPPYAFTNCMPCQAQHHIFFVKSQSLQRMKENNCTHATVSKLNLLCRCN